jgi:hypothetical protein
MKWCLESGEVISCVEKLKILEENLEELISLKLSFEELHELVNNALGFIEDRASLDQVESAVQGIKEKYQTEFYAFELIRDFLSRRGNKDGDGLWVLGQSLRLI